MRCCPPPRGRRHFWAAGLLLCRPPLGAGDPPPEATAASVTVWDFVVVGAGTGGALCAARLAAHSSSVLLLEAGKWDEGWLYDVVQARDRSSEPYVWAYPTRLPGQLSVQNSKSLRKRVAAGKMVGGSSMVHGDVYDRPPVREFEYYGLRSWDHATVAAAFSRVEADLNLTWVGESELNDVPDPQWYIIDKLMSNLPLEHHSRGNVDGRKGGLAAGWTMFRSCPPNRSACRRHTSYSDLVPVWNTSAGPGGSGGGHPRLTVISEALVTRVLLEGGEAAGAEVRLHGELHEVYARRAVVLAAGAIGTPKILTLSGIGDPYELQRLGVPVQVANREVGQGLADHLAMFTWFMVAGGEELELDSKVCKDRELFNTFFNLTGAPTGGDGRVDAEVRFFTGCNMTRKTVDFGVEAVLLRPRSRGRVVVPSANPEVMPLVEYPPLWESDFEQLEAIYKRVADALGVSPEEFASDPGSKGGRTLAETVRSEAYLYQHFCCSARAAPEGQPGACGEDLAVRGVGRLYVADTSALPFPPSAHTSSSALLMGELAAASALALAARSLPERAAVRAEEPQQKALLLAAEPRRAAALQVPTLQLLSSSGGAAEVPLAMPVVGLGTGTLAASRTTAAVAAFLRLGGRHLDTAAMYDNYAEVRSGIEASGLTNLSEVVVTWKLMPLGRKYVRNAVAAALRGLGLNKVHIALLHWPGDVASGKLMQGMPLPSCVSVEDGSHDSVLHSWRACRHESYAALAEERAAGRVLSIGVSNFAAKHLDEMMEAGHGPPAVHQMELHPMWHDDELLARHEPEASRHAGASLRLPGRRAQLGHVDPPRGLPKDSRAPQRHRRAGPAPVDCTARRCAHHRGQYGLAHRGEPSAI